jgi:hypothetical protein
MSMLEASVSFFLCFFETSGQASREMRAACPRARTCVHACTHKSTHSFTAHAHPYHDLIFRFLALFHRARSHLICLDLPSFNCSRAYGVRNAHGKMASLPCTLQITSKLQKPYLKVVPAAR